MDIHMPVMGGVSATQLIRRGLNRQTPIIALTADVFADRHQCLDAIGIDDCIYKPVNDSKLIDILRKWGDRRRSVAQPGAQAHVQSTGRHAYGGEDRNSGVPAELQSMLHDS